ncbi:putative hemolysin [Litorivivens lipolytica]|uniref:L-ornithine N(alpha)-acyltransferase n=1 Tax=Litorivivens lipolytica TaxID=1524264 RepID=A0A7W4W5U4_9GAMM|nr:GNAT family N-acyltransferase [Litorivivens lipolytica]MBB3048021.1 putative hemolysin [Litorivivens lipolytica]
MICVDSVVKERFPAIAEKHPHIRSTLVTLFRYLFHESEFKQFERDYPHLVGIDFVDKALEYFDFDYSIKAWERERIPVSGKVVIVANHPIGSLDGLALLKMLSEIRPDVKVVANELLYSLKPLRPLLLPVDNMNGNTPKQNLKNIEGHLNEGGALIIFPAGEVSRLGPTGVKDSRWRTGFLRFASKTSAPILPVHVNARNSLFFYALSLLAKPISTLWLIREMFKQHHRSARLTIGPIVETASYESLPLTPRAKAQLFRRHVYKLGARQQRGEKHFMPQMQSVAHPEDRRLLRQALRSSERLGTTCDGMEIFCFRASGDSVIMRELGRLREISFRAVGEGTGNRRDTDIYDTYYDHILLWDDNQLELVGAYRLARCAALNADQTLYTSTLFNFSDQAAPYLQQGVELGRSFVQPQYWGKAALDYLWQGVGAYLSRYPDVRYLFGPVSISNELPSGARELLVEFYRKHFPPASDWAIAKLPYAPGTGNTFEGRDYSQEFIELKARLAEMGASVPPLYKQYSELCETGGVQFAAYNIDPDFADCVDGLVLVDISKMKPARRKRYLGASTITTTAS